MDGATTKVSDGITTITSPLGGKNWLGGNGPSNTSDHRRSIIGLDGTPHISQRYAIDWVQIDEKGSTYKGETKDIAAITVTARRPLQWRTRRSWK